MEEEQQDKARPHYPKVIITLTAIAAFAATIIYTDRKFTRLIFPSAVEYVRQTQKPVSPRPLKRVRDLRNETPLPEPLEAARAPLPAEPKLSDVCEGDWSQLYQTDLLTLESDLTAQKPVLSTECAELMRTEIKIGLIQEFLTECQNRLTEKSPDTIAAQCVPLLPSFRAYAIRLMRSNESDLRELEAADLGNQLAGGFVDLGNASLEEIDRNIALADALIEKDRDVYGAYKGKLLSLLVRELKFKEKVEAESYEELYGELMNFQVTPPALPAEDGLNEATELASLDPDLVQIPFLRLKALGDHEALYQLAQEYSKAFPSSFVGHLWAAEALWAEGEEAAAIERLRSVAGKELSAEAAREIIQRTITRNPLSRLYEMSIE